MTVVYVAPSRDPSSHFTRKARVKVYHLDPQCSHLVKRHAHAAQATGWSYADDPPVEVDIEECWRWNYRVCKDCTPF